MSAKLLFAICISISFYTSAIKAQNSNGMPTGNIGIGTASPNALLQVHNVNYPANTVGATVDIAHFTGVANNFLQFRLLSRRHTVNGDWTAVGGRLQYLVDVSNQGYLEFNPKGDSYGIALGSGEKEFIRFRLNGNVGIGTTNPGATLTVDANSQVDGSDAVLFDKPRVAVAAAARYTFNNVGGTGSDDAFWRGFHLAAPYVTVAGSNTFPRFSIYASYNSLTDPTFKRWVFRAGNASFPQDIQFASDSRELIYMRSDGNIGIGTSSPDQLITVNAPSGGNSLLSLQQNGTTQAYVGLGMDGVFRNQTNNNTQLQLRADGGTNYITMYTNSTEKLRVTSNGNVGIGTTNPGAYKLAVEGTIAARKVKVTQEIPWADFVFEMDYRLMPLTELSKFIEQHKHLPDVPTTEEVKANGLDLGANQALLLQKIEELTLYVIQQQREIDSLKAKLIEIVNK